MGTDTLTYSVSHRTVLRYSTTVTLSYNEVRMRARDRGSQRTLAFALVSTPWAVMYVSGGSVIRRAVVLTATYLLGTVGDVSLDHDSSHSSCGYYSHCGPASSTNPAN